jgi:hypothetical protein
MVRWRFTQLAFADFSQFKKLTDSMLSEFFAGCRHVTHLVLPYHSKLSDTSLSTLHYYLKDIVTLELKECGGSGLQYERNEGITDTQLARICAQALKLRSFMCHIVRHIFFEKLAKNLTEEQVHNQQPPTLSERLQGLKFTFVLFSEEKELESLVVLKKFTALNTLKLKNLLLITSNNKVVFNMQQCPDLLLDVAETLANNLTYLSLG